MIGADPIFIEPEGATPLGPDEMDGLIPTWVATRNDLNTVEHDNITEAMVWAIGKKWTADLLLSSDSICDLHRRMFCDVWKWAGTLRQRVTTIGVPPAQISVQLHNLLADVRAQVDSVDVCPWSVDEIAVRFHHRLVLIHPFPNGNGRHSRLAADLLAVSLGERRFTWGGANLASTVETRAEYMSALRRADVSFEYGPLLEFARS